MPSRDFDGEDEIGKLRSKKRYKLGGRKRNTDGECKMYLEDSYNTTLWSDSEDHRDRFRKPETPEKPLTPEVRFVAPPISRNSTNSNNTTQGGRTSTSS